jgi:uncharacterized phiE125 gp8 family phage protein
MMWDVKVITPPAQPVITLDEARQHLRLDATGTPAVHPDDDLIGKFVEAARQELEAPNGWLGRSLMTQTLQLTLPRFPLNVIKLPFSPVQTITSVKYSGSDGTEVTMDAAEYRLANAYLPALLQPVAGSWPDTGLFADAVQITYVAGADEVEELIKQYIKVRLGDFYSHREMVIAGIQFAAHPYARDSLENMRIRGSFP